MHTERRLRLPDVRHMVGYGTRPLTANPNYSYGGLNMLNQIQLK